MFKTILTSLSLLSVSSLNTVIPPVKPVTSFRFAGDTKPFGFFDPLMITTNANEETVKYLREAELQHSRTAMLSSIIFPIIEMSTNTPAINVLSGKSDAAQIAWLTFFGIYELARMNAGWENPFNGGKPFKLEDNYEPGAVLINENAKFFTEVDSERRLNVELNNGRLAMLGVAATMVNEIITQKGMFI
tara:strand:- start:56 stop:622 length:567 start_codon:yes stop_codon:yes gene_type:complete